MVFYGYNYEFEEDIPHLIINGKREIVESVFIQKSSLEMIIQIGNEKEVLDFENSTIPTDSMNRSYVIFIMLIPILGKLVIMS